MQEQTPFFAAPVTELEGRSLLAFDGHPVWPCPDAGLRERLECAARNFGGRIEMLAPGDVEPAAHADVGHEVVVSLGRDLLSHGELYAHLTGRRAIAMDDLDRLDDHVAVVVATWDQLQVRHFEMLHDHSARRSPVGLVVGRDRAGLLDRILVQAATARLCAHLDDLPPLPVRVISNGETNPEFGEGLVDEAIGLNAGADDVARLLGGPSSVLGIVGHSDGIDAMLSTRAVLCSRVRPREELPPARAANCDLSGFCHRRQVPRAEALASGELIAPDQIAARVLLLFSCYVALGSDCSADPRTGLLRQLLDNPRIGAVVAPWEVSAFFDLELVLLLEPAARGSTIGSAWQAFQSRAVSARSGANRLLLFGDPRVRAASHSRDQEEIAPLVEEALRQRLVPTVQPPRGEELSHLHWLESRVESMADDSRLDGELTTRARGALEQIHAGERDRRDFYRHFLSLAIAHDAAIFKHWTEDAPGLPQAVDRPTRCFACGASGRMFWIETPFAVRWMARCVRCQCYYADTPSGSDLIDASFGVTPLGGIEHAIPASPNQVLAVHLISPLVRATWFWDEAFDLADLPPVRSWVWLYSLSDDGLLAYCRLLDNRPVAARVAVP